MITRLFIVIFSTMASLHPLVRADESLERFLTPPKVDGPVHVKVSFDLQRVDGINDEEESFGFNGVLRLSWKDPRQAFDPAMAGTSEKIRQGAYQVDELSPGWFPQIYLANESGLYETDAVTLRVKPDGTSTFTCSINAIAECHFSMRKYPFDTQLLDAVFRVPGFTKDEIVFVAGDTKIDSSMRLSQWDLTSIRIEPHSDPSPGFSIVLDAKRDPLFNLRLVAMPLALIVMLSWSVFWMERSSLGDRISVSFVGILTAVAYQIVVGDLLPHVSYITLMHGFLNLSFFVMSATVVINLVVGACDRKGRSDLGDRIDHHCRWIFPLTYFGLIPVIFLIAFHLKS
jgi:hypothetical protein